jgi:hypothetical protein
MTTMTDPLQIDLTLPASWVDVSPVGEDSGPGYRTTVANLADLQIPPAVPSAIRLLLAELVAQQPSAVLCSYLLDAVAGDEGDVDFVFATAAVLAYEVDGDGSIDDLRASVRATGAGAALAVVDDVVLGDRPGIRRHALRPSPLDGQRSQLDVRYFVPIADDGWLVVLVFATPDGELADDWLALFDAIAGSLHISAPTPDS